MPFKVGDTVCLNSQRSVTGTVASVSDNPCDNRKVIIIIEWHDAWPGWRWPEEIRLASQAELEQHTLRQLSR